MASLSGNTIKGTYSSLLKTNDNSAIAGTGATADQMSDGAGNTTQLYISQTRMGIGASSPAGVLEIQSANDAGVPALLIDNDDVDQYALKIEAANTTTDAFYINSSNTTADIISLAGSALTSGNGINVRISSTAGGGGAALKVRQDSTGDIVQLLDGTTEVVSVVDGGNVGIMTTAPDRALEVNNSGGNCLRLTYNDSNGSATYYTDFGVSSAGILSITPIGDIVTITSDGNTKLQISSSATDGDSLIGFSIDNGSNYIYSLGVDDGDSDIFKIIAGDNFDSEAQERICITGTEVVFNEGSADIDFRVESNSNSHMLFLDAGNDRIGINTNSPAVGLDIRTPINIGVDDTGQDVKLFGATSGSYMLWDESADALILTDSTPINIGDSTDMAIYHDGSNSYIKHSGTGELRIGTTTTGKAISIGHTTSETTVNDNLTVTGNITAGGNVTVTGTLDLGDTNITNLGSVALDTITNDGTDITIDSGGDIVLDAGGTQIYLKDDGTLFGSLTNSSGQLVIKSSASDTTAITMSGANVAIAGDLTVSGNDIKSSGATAITMSGANVTLPGNLTVTGTSTINDHVTVAQDKKIYFDSTDTYIYANTDSAEDLVIGADDNIILEPDGEVTVSAGNLALTDGNLVITAADHGIIHTNSGTVTQGTNATTGVTLNTTSGVITTYAATLATNTEVQFAVTNSTVQADSVVICTMQDENTDANSHILVTTNTIAGGSFNINLFNCGSGTASATACKIHFLVINNS